MTATPQAPLGLGEREVHVTDHVWVEVGDGCRLSARLWIPAGAEAEPVGAVLECVPYRKNDGTAVGDDQQMRFFASHGFAGVRLDLRGSGDSEGLLLDEYLPSEQADIIDVLAWIGAQPWCSGRVGMMGASWGGFNSLQVAALRPPELAAVISVYASDDRYADDVHYRGGCVIGMDMLHWAASMLAFNAKPPDPEVVGAGWREEWRARLDGTPPYIDHWLAHQRRDNYWRQGSVRDDPTAIECPVLAIGGWTDGYTDAVLRLLASLEAPSRGLIGPWGHSDPASGAPGPHAGFLSECLRWWRHWLGGEETGVMDEPQLRFFMQERAEPAGNLAERPGRWAAEEVWPAQGHEPLRLEASCDGTLAPAGEGRTGELRLRGLQSCGLDGGAWCADGRSADLPLDQRRDEGASIVFTSEPLAKPLEIAGFARFRAELAVDRPWALLSARLSDVEPGGGSALVTRGQFNLTHREGHDRVLDAVPGEPFEVEFEMDAIAHRFEAGNRIRLAISPTYWPLAWPSPETVELTLLAGPGTWLELPARPLDAGPSDWRRPDPPEATLPERPTTVLEPHVGARRVVRELGDGSSDLIFEWDQGGLFRDDVSGIESEDFSTVRYSIRDGDPLSAEVECHNRFVIARGDWRTHGTVHARMTSTATDFVVDTEANAFEGDELFWERSWQHRFPRDGV